MRHQASIVQTPKTIKILRPNKNKPDGKKKIPFQIGISQILSARRARTHICRSRTRKNHPNSQTRNRVSAQCSTTPLEKVSSWWWYRRALQRTQTGRHNMAMTFLCKKRDIECVEEISWSGCAYKDFACPILNVHSSSTSSIPIFNTNNQPISSFHTSLLLPINHQVSTSTQDVQPHSHHPNSLHERRRRRNHHSSKITPHSSHSSSSKHILINFVKRSPEDAAPTASKPAKQSGWFPGNAVLNAGLKSIKCSARYVCLSISFFVESKKHGFFLRGWLRSADDAENIQSVDIEDLFSEPSFLLRWHCGIFLFIWFSDW